MSVPKSKKTLKSNWDYRVSEIQSEIASPDSYLNGKIINKIDFWIKNRKHVWMKTIEKMPCPLNPDKTVGETMTIHKYKNHITLFPLGNFKIVKDGVVRDMVPEDYYSKPINSVGVSL